MIVQLERIKDFPLPDTSAGRSKGVHVSSIIRCIATEIGILKPEEAEELSLVDVRDMSKIGIVAQLRIHMGLAWEEHYLPLIPDIVKHPGEVELDGVYMTTDGESVSVVRSVPSVQYGLKIHETKLTYKSTNNTGATGDRKKPLTGRENLMWRCQLMSYCLAKKTRYGDLHALHVCGDYIRPIQPSLWVYHCEFTQEELEDNWAWQMDYKEYKMKEEQETR